VAGIGLVRHSSHAVPGNGHAVNFLTPHYSTKWSFLNRPIAGLNSAGVSRMRTTTSDRAGSVIELPARTGQGRGATRFG